MILELANLSKTFQTPQGPVGAVRDVSLSLAEGECLAVVGESGSGKTTLANMVLGILAPSAGEIRFDGTPLAPRRSPAERRAIQLVQQNPLSALNPKRSVGASVRLGLDTYGIGARGARWGIVEAAMEAVGLPAEMRHRAPSALSGGQRQRVAIARALILQPKLIVLDEPTSALDPLIQAQILTLLRELQQKYGLTYIFISHDLKVIKALCNRILVLYQGRIVEQGETETIFSQPQTDYCQQLIQAAWL